MNTTTTARGVSEAGSAHRNEDPVKMARAICEAIIKHQFQDEHRHGRLTIDVETLLREFNAARDAGRTAALSAERAAQGEEVVDRVAKAIADAAGHGMREKCEHMAHAAIAAYQLATWNTAPPAQPAERVPDGVFYIDCEFDGHNGPLLSIALVAKDGRSVHIKTDAIASDPWVIANVVPLLDEHHAQTSVTTHCNGVGEAIRAFLAGCNTPEIVADSPVDIARFCASLSTDASGHWASADYPRLTFRVENVDCYPTTLEGAVQHNAWWDAMALRHKLTASLAPSEGGKGVES